MKVLLTEGQIVRQGDPLMEFDPRPFFAIGPSSQPTVLRRRAAQAVTAEAQAAYDASVADYRQSLLIAFQQMEDNLAALRVLQQESEQEAAAVNAAEESLSLALIQYRGGVAAYLQVITAQEAALQNETAAVSLLTRSVTSSVSLIRLWEVGGASLNCPPPTRSPPAIRLPLPARARLPPLPKASQERRVRYTRR